MKNFFVLLFVIAISNSYGQVPLSDIDLQGNRKQVLPASNAQPSFSPMAGNTWTSIGPFGGDITDMSGNPLYPEKLFAVGTTPFVSGDGGNNWTKLNSLITLSGGNVNAIESSSNGTMIATSPYIFGKVFRSTDGGSSWQNINTPVNTPGLCVSIDPQDSNTFYVGLSSNLSATVNEVIIRSTDGGLTWNAFDMTSVLPVGTSVVDICVDPDNSQTIFAIGISGFSTAYCVASFNGGTSWEDFSINLPAGVPFNAVKIADQKVFIAGGQLFGSQYMGVYMSEDWGLGWTNISTLFPNKVSNDLLIDPTNPDVMYVATEGDGIYYTHDGGLNWNYNTNGAGENGAARCLIFRTGSTSILFAGYLSIAICKSVDAGNSWVYAHNGISTLNINDIDIDPVQPSRVLAGFEAENSGGCYMSADTGNTWTMVTGLPGTRYSKVTFGADGAMYAWSNGPSSIAQEGLYKSTDNGINWVNKGPNIGSYFETEIFAIAASETNPELIFIGGNNFGLNGWESMIYRTINGGQTWQNVYMGSPDNSESFQYLSIKPGSNDQVIYAAMKSDLEGKLLRSEDGGNTWTSIGDNIPLSLKYYSSVVCDPDQPAKIILGCGGNDANGRIIISEDNGATWNSPVYDLGAQARISDIVVSPQNSNVIYASTIGEGVILSEDGGLTWNDASDGLPSGQVSALSHAFPCATGWEVLASTYNSSAFKTELVLSGAGLESLQESSSGLLVYPNPFHGSTSLDVSTCRGKVTAVEVRDASGRLYRKISPPLVNQTGTILLTDIQPGIYYLRIITTAGTEYAKLCSM